jgi:glutamate carboxypeptidase
VTRTYGAMTTNGPANGEAAKIEDMLGITTDAARDRVLERVGAYVSVESPSGYAPGIDALSRRIENDLAEIGARVEAFDAPEFGRNLIAHVDGAEPDAGTVVILTHIDTVHPLGTLARQPFVLVDGRVEGPGVYDMKTGVALVVEALATLRRHGRPPRRPVRFLVSCDEEIGSHSARPLIERLAGAAAVALVPEPSLPDGSIKTSRKGVSTYRFDVTGRAAHAGTAPAAGINAVVELSHQLPRMHALADHARGTTVTVGVLHAGTASNVVAGAAWGTIDVRSVVPEEAERVDRGLAALRPEVEGAQLAIRRTENRPPLVRSDAVVALYERARTVAASLGADIGEGLSGGGSDGSLIAALGVPTLDGLGPRGGGAHAIDEHVVVDDLPFRVAFLARLLETL